MLSPLLANRSRGAHNAGKLPNLENISLLTYLPGDPSYGEPRSSRRRYSSEQDVLRANARRSPDYPLLLIGRESKEEFDAKKGGLPGAARPTYFYTHEEDRLTGQRTHFVVFLNGCSNDRRSVQMRMHTTEIR